MYCIVIIKDKRWFCSRVFESYSTLHRIWGPEILNNLSKTGLVVLCETNTWIPRERKDCMADSLWEVDKGWMLNTRELAEAALKHCKLPGTSLSFRR